MSLLFPRSGVRWALLITHSELLTDLRIGRGECFRGRSRWGSGRRGRVRDYKLESGERQEVTGQRLGEVGRWGIVVGKGVEKT